MTYKKVLKIYSYSYPYFSESNIFALVYSTMMLVRSMAYIFLQMGLTDRSKYSSNQVKLTLLNTPLLSSAPPLQIPYLLTCRASESPTKAYLHGG
tara:strand:+ start:483 stop:767 length:285 start_codon:yes stop_codon:yes gene_type:complete